MGLFTALSICMMESRVSQHLISRESCLLHFRRQRPTFGKWDSVSHSIPHRPAVTSSPPQEGTRRMEHTPKRGTALGQRHAGAEMLSQPAASLPAQGEMHSPAMEQGRQLSAGFLAPVAHRRRVTPAGKQRAASCHASPAARPSRGAIHLCVVFQKRHTNFCRVGSAESR